MVSTSALCHRTLERHHHLCWHQLLHLCLTLNLVSQAILGLHLRSEEPQRTHCGKVKGTARAVDAAIGLGCPTSVEPPLLTHKASTYIKVCLCLISDKMYTHQLRQLAGASHSSCPIFPEALPALLQTIRYTYIV